MSKKQEKLKELYEKMAALTKPKCMGSCVLPNSCCERVYCEDAEKYAKEKGFTFQETHYPTKRNLKFMSEKGCIIPPWLRPICAVHVCENQLMRDVKFGEKYFELRSELNDLEYEVWGEERRARENQSGST